MWMVTCRQPKKMTGENTGQMETLLKMKMETVGDAIRFFVIVCTQVMAVPPLVFPAYYTGRGGKMQYISAPRLSGVFRRRFGGIAQRHSSCLWGAAASWSRRPSTGHTPAATRIFSASPGR